MTFGQIALCKTPKASYTVIYYTINYNACQSENIFGKYQVNGELYEFVIFQLA